MRKFWQVCLREYCRHVFRLRFIFTLMSLPAFILIALVVVILLVRTEKDVQSLGYVDHSGLFDELISSENNGNLSQIYRFNTEAEAEIAVRNQQIQAFYVLEETFVQTGRTKLVALELPDYRSQRRFEGMIRAILIARQPTEVVRRINQGIHLIIRTIDGSRQFSETDRINLFIPTMALFVFFLIILSTSGYLMHAMTEEKENRTLEIIITSISPTKLMAAKISAIVAIGITMLVVWSGFLLIGILISPNSSHLLESVNIPFGTASLFVLTSVFVFVMIAAIIASVGALASEATEGLQITGPFSIPFIIPYFFLFQIMTNPNSSLAVMMSFVPFTAPVTLIMRASFASIPEWQIILSLLIQAAFAIGLIWVAGRAFRLGMLQYRRHLDWRELFVVPR